MAYRAPPPVSNIIPDAERHRRTPRTLASGCMTVEKEKSAGSGNAGAETNWKSNVATCFLEVDSKCINLVGALVVVVLPGLEAPLFAV